MLLSGSIIHTFKHKVQVSIRSICTYSPNSLFITQVMLQSDLKIHLIIQMNQLGCFWKSVFWLAILLLIMQVLTSPLKTLQLKVSWYYSWYYSVGLYNLLCACTVSLVNRKCDFNNIIVLLVKSEKIVSKINIQQLSVENFINNDYRNGK